MNLFIWHLIHGMFQDIWANYSSYGDRWDETIADSMTTRLIWRMLRRRTTISLTTHINERLGFFSKAPILGYIAYSWQIRVGTLAMLPISLSESEEEREAVKLGLDKFPFEFPLPMPTVQHNFLQILV